jgi:putative ATP-dependent endonuclease of OLD family
MMQRLGNLVKIGFKNFKCFNENINWLEVTSITVLVGKNNSGKSSVVEVIQQLCSPKFNEIKREKYHRKGMNEQIPQIFVRKKFDEKILSKGFRPGTFGGGIPGNEDHWYFGERNYLHLEYTYLLKEDPEIIEIHYQENSKTNQRLDLTIEKNYLDLMRGGLKSPFANNSFLSLSAEREIVPEINDQNLYIKSNGRGLTNAIQAFLNYENYPSYIVEENVLTGLNQIFAPDHKFSRIFSQINQSSGFWEIYLEEDNRKISLSNCGAGIKTVILALGLIHLMPIIQNKKLEDYIICLEELENNLHPSLLRKLLTYLEKVQLKTPFKLFITTHSNVSIDFFINKENSQIVHVQNKEGSVQLKAIKNFHDNKNILKDLDVKASDLLQANGIIWVEGPSDRIYLNKWIELWSEGGLIEGVHYQCLFYGGRLLSNLSSDLIPEKKFIDMLKINSNLIVIIDSDKKLNTDSINATKSRVCEEVTSAGGLAWVTAGREIENYNSLSNLNECLQLAIQGNVNSFESVFDLIDATSSGKGKKLSKEKPNLALLLVNQTTKEDWLPILDLNHNMEIVVSKIKEWNSLE